jgi:3-hydroxyisobutyrate dehydrogenase
MGGSMAGHLLAAGYPLHVHNRTKSRAEELLRQGAQWHDSPGSVAAVCDIVFTIVGFPADVEQVYLGDNGIIAHSQFGAILVDMTTSSPLLARRIYEKAYRLGVSTLDAPVSGGDVGARDARLSIMVGGDKPAFEAVLPLFRLMGTNVVYQGPAGSGQHTKMANQIAIASCMMGVCEALAYATRAGLNPETVLQSIGNGAAASWALSNLGPRMIKGDFAPGFFVKHFIKDIGIAIESARAMGLDTPGLAQAEALYQKLAAQGGGDDGTQALYQIYR